MKLSKAQRKMYEDVKRDGRRYYNGRARRTIEILKDAGLVEYEFDVILHGIGPATERYTVTIAKASAP